jgi:3-oxoacyl-[acyl-carrier protein] reductase
MPLTEDIALVTGASRGIGQSIAMALGKQGAKVVGTATTETGAAAIQAAFDEQGVQGLGLALDVTDPDAIDRLASAGQVFW